MFPRAPQPFRVPGRLVKEEWLDRRSGAPLRQNWCILTQLCYTPR